MPKHPMKETDFSETEIRSEEVRDIVSQMPSGLIRYGNLLLLILVLALMLGLYVIKYPDVLTSDIVITTRLPPARIVVNTTGKLIRLQVQNNHVVPKDCILGVIESSADFEDVQAVKKAIRKNGAVSQSDYQGDSELVLGEIEPAYTQWEDALKEYEIQRKLTPELRETVAVRKQVTEYQSLLQKQVTQAKIYQEELEIYQNDYQRNQGLLEEKVLSVKEFEEKRKEYLLAKRNFESLKIEAANTKITLNELDKSLVLLLIKEDKTTFNLDRQLQDKLRALEVAIKRWEQLYLLKAPIAGRVSYLQFLTANQNVKQGDEICSIIPGDSTELLGRVFMPVRNSGKVKTGQSVNICLDSYPCQEWGMLKGRVTHVSLVPQSGKYTIEVELLVGMTTSYHKTLGFKQEMPGTAKIVTEDLRLIERIFHPFRQVFDQ